MSGAHRLESTFLARSTLSHYPLGVYKMTASERITSGYLPATLIGFAPLVVSIVMTTAAIMSRGRRNQTKRHFTAPLSDPVPSGMGASLSRCRVLIAEAVIVRQRLSGDIDAATYRASMSDLAWEAVLERHPQRNN
jgi:hypothetical protein